MKKIYIISPTLILLALAVFLGLGNGYETTSGSGTETSNPSATGIGNEISHSRGVNTIISSNSKLWFVTEKGELFTRKSDWDFRTLSETNVAINKIINEGADIQALSSPSSYSKLIFAIKNDGTVWQLIENPDTNQYSLEKVNGIENCIKIINGEKHIMVLTSDGFVYAWGDNTYGQLGDGTNENRDTPKKIPALSDIVDISSGSHHCMALSRSGEVYTWGDNVQGQIGNGSYANSEEERNHNSVYQVEALSDIIQISAGGALCMALQKDGTVYDWGSRNTGVFCLPTPTEVKSLENIVQISAHGLHGLALSSSGELWRWGSVDAIPGEGMHLPRKMADFPNAIEIIAGEQDIVVTKDNEIWQGFMAILDETDVDPCYSGKFLCIFSKEDVQEYGIKLGTENVEKLSEWAEGYVDTAIKDGLLPPKFQNNYTKDITRLEYCQLVDNFLFVNKGQSIRDNNLKPPFTDVEDSSVTVLWNNGIINGKSETQFCPYDFITREELATILKRIYGFMGNDRSNAGDGILFDDNAEISEWAKDSVSFVSSHGIMIGANNKFRPKDYSTKQETIITLVRLSDMNK